MDADVVLGLDHPSPEGSGHDHDHDRVHQHGHDHSQDHDHHHDHTHVDISSGVVQLEGLFDRTELELQLPQLIQRLQVVRLKGRVWLPDKSLPLQIQMVGPRLNSWFESAPDSAWRPSQAQGLDLVVLSFQPAAAEQLEQSLSSLMQPVRC